MTAAAPELGCLCCFPPLNPEGIVIITLLNMLTLPRTRMKSDTLLTTRRYVSLDLNEGLSCDLCGRVHVSCFKAIRFVVGYTLSVTLFVTAASHCVIKTEPPCAHNNQSKLSNEGDKRIIIQASELVRSSRTNGEDNDYSFFYLYLSLDMNFFYLQNL